MLDFTFQNSTKILFGRTAIDGLADEILAYSDRILLHYGGGSIKNNGIYSKVVSLLRAAGVHFAELGGVLPNPRLSLVKEGVALCRRERLGLVLAVGGGSAIDSAKAIALGVPYQGDVWDFYAGTAVPQSKIPVGTICTIPAAGSEMSFSAVITNEEGWAKRGVNTPLNNPEFSVLNPEFAFTLPPYQTACGCADILAHLMERYFTQDVHVDLTDRLLEGAMQTVINFAPRALATPDDYDIRAEITWAACLAHNGLFNTGRTGDWASHKISYELSALYDLAHGAALSIIFPAWMRYVYHSNPGRFIQFASRVFSVNLSLDRSEEIALEGISRLEDFYRSLGLPVRLNEAGITSEKINEMAARAVPDPQKPLGFFRGLDQKDVACILNMAK